jgi:flap endonuclease-1
MGVKMLNKYLKEFTPRGIKQIPLSNLRNKKIAIDVSIFIYQFLGNQTLIESMYKMIKLFRDNHIIPIFVFDGAPPEEKFDVIKERDAGKKRAKETCQLLDKQIKDEDDYLERERLEKKLFEEKKKCIRVTNENIRSVKELITVMGVNYLEADGEADELCAYLIKKKMVWACLSEDMDMFVYGCSRVLRSFNINTKTLVLYELDIILSELSMTFEQFNKVCLLAGTDYNRGRFTIFTAMGFFYKFVKKKKNSEDFYNWLVCNRTLTHDDVIILNKSITMFIIKNYNFPNTQYLNKRIFKQEVENYMKKYDYNYLQTIYNGL